MANYTKGRKPNAGQFKPGVTTNPRGRPKLDPNITKMARKATPAIMRRMIRIALGKEKVDEQTALRAMLAVMDRAWGTPRQSMEITGDVTQFVVRLPPVARTAADWEASPEMQDWRAAMLEDKRPN